jgi:hypothetical protein
MYICVVCNYGNKASIEDKIINIEFDYFDQNQGGIIKVIHSGKRSSDLIINGTFKSVGEIKELNASVFDVALNTAYTRFLFFKIKDKRLFSKRLPWVTLISGLGLLSAFFFIQTVKVSNKVLFAVVGSIYSLIGIGMIFSMNSLPKNFKAFYDDE